MPMHHARVGLFNESKSTVRLTIALRDVIAMGPKTQASSILRHFQLTKTKKLLSGPTQLIPEHSAVILSAAITFRKQRQFLFVKTLLTSCKDTVHQAISLRNGKRVRRLAADARCPTSIGVFVGTQQEPDFWNDSLRIDFETPVEREFAIHWHCCEPKCLNHFIAVASPSTK